MGCGGYPLGNMVDIDSIPVYLDDHHRFESFTLRELPQQMRYIFNVVDNNGLVSDGTPGITPPRMYESLNESIRFAPSEWTPSYIKARSAIGYSPRSDFSLAEGAD